MTILQYYMKYKCSSRQQNRTNRKRIGNGEESWYKRNKKIFLLLTGKFLNIFYIGTIGMWKKYEYPNSDFNQMIESEFFILSISEFSD